MRRGRRTRRGQRGGVLPALALALFGGGALWLSLAPLRSGATVDEARRALLDARRAVLAHVSAYPESYGPLGAGPGHLPCPDTDTPLDAAPGAVARTRPGGTGGASASFRGDGPNPPCGNGPLALGRLPRHVTIGARREPFHVQTGQRFVYAVSTRFVNNPLDRPVNPGTGEGPAEALRDDTVAVIVDAGDAALPRAAFDAVRDPADVPARVRALLAGRDRLVRHASLHRDELLAAAARRVAIWFAETAVRMAGLRCSAKNAERKDDAADIGEGPSPCPGGLSWPVHAVDATGCEPSPEGRILAWIGDDFPTAESMAVSEADDGTDGGAGGCEANTPPALPDTIEEVARERHWFVRNGWPRFVAVTVDARCRDPDVPCAPRPIRGDAPVSIRLAPSAGEGAP